jgi:molybdenum cofactor cytidylyltransferase
VKIAGVVLAAGASTRLGRPKQTLLIESETLVERAVRVAQEAGLAPVIVVVADETLKVAGAESVLNVNASEGMSSSIRCGVSSASDCDGVVLMACDQPALSAEHLQALIAEPAEIAGSAYAGRVGVPAYFPKSSFEALLVLEGDAGARELLRGVRQVPQENLSFDIDTKEDLARWKTK